MKQSFVTGASGFLGSTLVDLLLREGHQVTCLVRRTSNLEWLKGKPVKLIYGDLTPENSDWQTSLKTINYFFHVAGLLSTTNLTQYYKVNAKGTKLCLEACLKYAPELSRFVLVSSLAAIGPAQDGEPLNEDSFPRPITDYGKSKLAGEQIALNYKDRLPVVALRPPAIYGSRDRALLPIFHYAKKGLFFLPGKRKRTISMVHVSDVARACLWAATEEKAKGEVYFVADGDRYEWKEVAAVLEKIRGKSICKVAVPKILMKCICFFEEKKSLITKKAPRIHSGHVKQFYEPAWDISTKKINQAGFYAEYSLAKGMSEAWNGYKELGWL